MKDVGLARLFIVLTIMHSSLFLFCRDEKTAHSRRKARALHKREVWKSARQERNYKPIFRNRPPSKHRVTYFLGNIGKDMIDLNKNLFHWDSFKILITTFPFFVAA